MDCDNLTSGLSAAVWRKSTYSTGTGGNCVEVAMGGGGVVAVRDSKNTAGPMLTCTRDAWRTFIRRVRSGCYDGIS
jgi:hypothetical protein